MTDSRSTMPEHGPDGAVPQPDRTGRAPRPWHDPLFALPAFASLGAGVIHVAAVGEHRDWWLTIAFFSLLAAFQIMWGLFLLVRPMPRAMLLLGGAVNLGALTAWVISRAEGMPFGPAAGVPEPIGRADVLACALGAVVVLGAGHLAGGWESAGRLLRSRPVLATGGSALAVSAISVLALTSVSGHAHGEGGGHSHGSAPASPAGAESSTVPRKVAGQTVAEGQGCGLPITGKPPARVATTDDAHGDALPAQQRCAASAAPVAGAPGNSQSPKPSTSDHDADGHAH